MWAEAAQNRAARQALSQPVKDGTYIEFTGEVGFDLAIKSLEDFRKGIRILNVRQETSDAGVKTYATVYIPSGKENHFLGKIRKYLEEDTRNGQPKNSPLVNSIQDIRLAVLESFWTDPIALLPQAYLEKQCELWIKTIQGQEEVAINRVRAGCELLDIEFFENRIVNFPERSVVLVQANRNQLLELLEATQDIAEIRAAKETAAFWVNQPNIDQVDWTRDLLGRLRHNDHNIGICVLDTGVNNGHPLLAPILADNDCSAFNPIWGVNDHDGHGTLMSGIAAYGSLEEALEAAGEIELNHKLSSVKILPPTGGNPPDLYGAITQQAISLSEIAAPNRTQIFCCAVTSDIIDHKGKPTSWSGAIDSITSGQVDGERRLYIVSAGNVRNTIDWNGYPDINLLRSIEDPAQSWNSLTVGAYTEKVTFTDPLLANDTVIAPLRGLSPYSTCSTLWESKWPLKPEIVVEGGNIRRSPNGDLYEAHPDLSLLTTSRSHVNNQYDVLYATSAATAKAAWLAAKIQTQYPNAWPETVKGLLIHSAEWPDAIINQYQLDISRKRDITKLMRICGFGVPDLDRAIHCSNSTLTLVSQAEIQPYAFNEERRPITKDMHVYELPWPADLLLSMGATQVKLRVTLSYFIEPAPGEIGWKDKYRYASHAFRFDVNNPSETRHEFLSRLNVAAREEGDDPPGNSGSGRWSIGADNRAIGSVHSDIWEGNAADIAACNMIGVYPVVGWWRERKHLGNVEKRTRYSLIVSLITPTQDIDIYTPIVDMIRIPIEIPSS